jgi:hypothetical protein
VMDVSRIGSVKVILNFAAYARNLGKLVLSVRKKDPLFAQTS